MDEESKSVVHDWTRRVSLSDLVFLLSAVINAFIIASQQGNIICLTFSFLDWESKYPVRCLATN